MNAPTKLAITGIDESRTYNGMPYFQVAPVYKKPDTLTVDCPGGSRLTVTRSYYSGEWQWMVTGHCGKSIECSEDSFATAEEAVADFNGYVDSKLFCYGD